MVLITEEHTSCRRIKKGIVIFVIKQRKLSLDRDKVQWTSRSFLSGLSLTYLLLSLMKLEQKNSNVKSVIYFDFFQRWLLRQWRRSEQHFLVVINTK